MAHKDETEREALRAFGEAIRQTREEQGLDVDQLAASAGISAGDVRALEAGDLDVAAELLRPTQAHEDETEREALSALGEAIRQTREEQGLDVDQLAAASDISADDVRALEAGHLDVSIYVVRLISAAAGEEPSRADDLAEKLERYRGRPPSHDRNGE